MVDRSVLPVHELLPVGVGGEPQESVEVLPSLVPDPVDGLRLVEQVCQVQSLLQVGMESRDSSPFFLRLSYVTCVVGSCPTFLEST